MRNTAHYVQVVISRSYEISENANDDRSEQVSNFHRTVLERSGAGKSPSFFETGQRLTSRHTDGFSIRQSDKFHQSACHVRFWGWHSPVAHEINHRDV